MFAFHRDGIWWALKSQRDMALDLPITNTMHIGSHNAANARRGVGGGDWDSRAYFTGLVGPNQTFTIPEQLSIGARYVELDVTTVPIKDATVYFNALVTFHYNPKNSNWRPVLYNLRDIAGWLNRPENQNEIVIIDFEDQILNTENWDDRVKNMNDTDRTWWFNYMEAALRGLLVQQLVDDQAGNSLIYTLDDFQRNGNRWPTQRQMVDLQRRIIILSDHSIFLNAQTPAGEDRIAFGWHGTLPDYFVKQVGTINFSENSTAAKDRFERNDNPDGFYILQGDSQGRDQDIPGDPSWWIRCLYDKSGGKFNFGEYRVTPTRMWQAANMNINIVKMDFLLGNEYHILPKYTVGALWNDHDLNSNQRVGLEDKTWGCKKNSLENVQRHLWDVPPTESSYDRLRWAVWSWRPGDPAPMRSAYNDMLAGDNTGSSLYTRHRVTWEYSMREYSNRTDGSNFFTNNSASDFLHPDVLVEIARQAVSNGQDVVLQDGNLTSPRWYSVAPGYAARPYSLRTMSRVYPKGTPETADMNNPAEFRLPLNTENGAYLWTRSQTAGTWDMVGTPDALFYPGDALVDEVRALNQQTGFRWFFAGPANGFQNSTLAYVPTPNGQEPQQTWINVNDLDRDGYWKVVSEPPPLIRVIEPEEEDDGEENEVEYLYTPTMAPEPMPLREAHSHCEGLEFERYMGLHEWEMAEGEHAMLFAGLAETGTYWIGEYEHDQEYGTLISLPDGTRTRANKATLAKPMCVAEQDGDDSPPHLPTTSVNQWVTPTPPTAETLSTIMADLNGGLNTNLAVAQETENDNGGGGGCTVRRGDAPLEDALVLLTLLALPLIRLVSRRT
ncbi:MAG: hypothetical protein OEY97_05140 [Nitrospirota bacterium]|nr:hypothetical protein [Nitrospirota bacterium]